MHTPSLAASWSLAPVLLGALGPLSTLAGVLPGVEWKRQVDNQTTQQTATETPFFTLYAISSNPNLDVDIHLEPVVSRYGYFFVDPVARTVDMPPPPQAVDCDDNNNGQYGDCGNGPVLPDPDEDAVILSTDPNGHAFGLQINENPPPVLNPIPIYLLTTTGVLAYQYPLETTDPLPPNAALTTFQRLGPGDPRAFPASLPKGIFDWGGVRPDLTVPGWFGCPVPTSSDPVGGVSGGLRLVKMLTPGMDMPAGCRGPWEMGVRDFNG